VNEKDSLKKKTEEGPQKRKRVDEGGELRKRGSSGKSKETPTPRAGTNWKNCVGHIGRKKRLGKRHGKEKCRERSSGGKGT